MSKETVIDVWVSKASNYKTDAFYISQCEQPNSVKATLTIPAPEKKMVKRVMYQSVFKSDGNAWIDLEGELFNSKEEATKRDGAIGVVAVEVELFAEGE